MMKLRLDILNLNMHLKMRYYHHLLTSLMMSQNQPQQMKRLQKMNLHQQRHQLQKMHQNQQMHQHQ